MEHITETVSLLLLIILFGGVLVWAFGRKRKKRFEEDGKIPFRKE